MPTPPTVRPSIGASSDRPTSSTPLPSSRSASRLLTPSGTQHLGDVENVEDLEPPAEWNGFTHPRLRGDQTDAWRCPCGNQPHADGFYPVDLQSTNAAGATIEVDPGLGGRWDGQHYGCATCGRVADFTLPGCPIVRGPRPFVVLV